MVTDIEFMQDENRWPQWPFLPVKKKDADLYDFRRLGVMFSSEGPTVFLTTLFEVSSLKDLKHAEKIEYTDYQAVVDAGWVVD